MVIEEQNSKFSGKLQVLKTFPWSKPYISTGFLTQSGGLVNDVWKPVIKLIKNYNSYLILGLSGGTLAKLIHKANPKAQIIGVEIDPAMFFIFSYISNFRINPAHINPISIQYFQHWFPVSNFSHSPNLSQRNKPHFFNKYLNFGI